MLKKINKTDLRLGMYIHEFGGSWLDHPFLRSRFLLKSIDDLNKIKASKVLELIIDIGKGIDVEIVASSTPTKENATKQPPTAEKTPVIISASLKPTTSEIEIGRAAQICAQSKKAVLDMFHDARMGKAVKVEQANELVSEISESVLRNPNALISLARLKNADEYTYMHSVAVCALMIALARELKLNEKQIRDAGMAGLLHDIGKMFVDDKILNKSGKLTDEEFYTVKKHPEFGFRALKDNDNVTDLAKEVCLHHHEKYDGSGYPHKLAGEKIHLFSRMGAVCDVYDAVTSNRPYKAGWEPAESLKRMASWEGHFDTKVFQAFVKTLGIYPVGSLVRLQSGRLAVVLDQHKGSLLTPRVKVFFSARSNTHLPQEIVDLSKSTDKIVGRESPQDWKFPNFDELWTGLPSAQW